MGRNPLKGVSFLLSVFVILQEQESLLLLDAAGHRTSVLYVPSGKTKRKLPKLSSLVEHARCYSPTKNGRCFDEAVYQNLKPPTKS